MVEESGVEWPGVELDTKKRQTKIWGVKWKESTKKERVYHLLH